MDRNRYVLIKKANTLVGKTKFASGARGKGTDNPAYLCCSGFVSWAFTRTGIHKMNFSTWDFCHKPNLFRKINASEAVLGDIALIQDSNSSAANHVGFFIGYRKDKPLFLHCSGHAGRNGVTIGTDDRLTIYYRYTGFND